MSRGSMNYTYIVKCSDGTFYTGWTNDLTRRMEAHNPVSYTHLDVYKRQASYRDLKTRRAERFLRDDA